MIHRLGLLLAVSCLASACQSFGDADFAPERLSARMVAPEDLAVKSWVLSDAPPVGELMVVRCDYDLAVAGGRRRFARELFVSTCGAAHEEAVFYVPERPSPTTPVGAWTVVDAGGPTGQQGHLHRACTSTDDFSLEFDVGDGATSIIVYTVRRESLASARERVPALWDLPEATPWKFVVSAEPHADGL